jgi:hypothetical protein
MKGYKDFFSFDLKQPVNQWLCIALLSLWCFWMVLYYSASHAVLIGQSYAAAAGLGR